jgi:type III secretion system low calcium response chaperone LcrH/SycD
MNEEDQKVVDLQVEKIAGNKSPQDKAIVSNIFVDIFQYGMTIMQAVGLSSGLVEMIFNYASELYAAEKYEEAMPLFHFICQMNHRDVRYVYGCGACYHKCHRYLQAVSCYTMAHSLDPDNPIYCYHGADCFLQLNQPESARVMLAAAIGAAGDAPQHQKLKQQAICMCDVIYETMQEQAAAGSGSS